MREKKSATWPERRKTLPNYKFTFGPLGESGKTVLVSSNDTKEEAGAFAKLIASDNEKLPEGKRVLGPLLSVESTDEAADSQGTFFALGQSIHFARFGW